MTSAKTKNSALKTALAFHYQVLIGVSKCFDLNENQSIWFEKDGDVSLIGENVEEASQTEVKDYSASLTDHHENLWKTIKNWLASDFDHSQYGSLVLHTTQSFGSKTKLKDWNTKTPKERLQTLKEIYNGRTEEEINSDKPSNIVKLQKAVMSTEDDRLKEVIAKVVLFTEADDIDVLENKVIKKLIGIPKSNQERYFQLLIGWVYSQSNSCSWSVKYHDFQSKCEELTTLLCKREYTFPLFTGYEATDIDIEKHQEQLFVQKINDIQHDEVIPDAIGNWIELQNSLNEQLDEFPLYKEKTLKYQEQIIKRFKSNYSTAKLSLDAYDPIKKSKILYNQTISKLPLNIDNIVPPMEYKNGLLHDAMDNAEFDLKWRIEQ